MRISHRVTTAAVLLAAGLAISAQQAQARDQDKPFFAGIAGVWKGPGEIVAGKYKGTKFNCTFSGEPAPGERAGVVMDGTCRVGVFNQEMKATILHDGSTYGGTFLDGAEGKGLDITHGQVDGDRVVVGIKRAQLSGAMVARLHDANTLNVTVSVDVGSTLVPVIGMTLARSVDPIAVGSIR
jgi:hypothetical protein